MPKQYRLVTPLWGRQSLVIFTCRVLLPWRGFSSRTIHQYASKTACAAHSGAVLDPSQAPKTSVAHERFPTRTKAGMAEISPAPPSANSQSSQCKGLRWMSAASCGTWVRTNERPMVAMTMIQQRPDERNGDNPLEFQILQPCSDTAQNQYGFSLEERSDENGRVAEGIDQILQRTRHG